MSAYFVKLITGESRTYRCRLATWYLCRVIQAWASLCRLSLG